MAKQVDMKVQTMRNVVFKLPFNIFAPITVSLPLGALIFCFTSAMIFQFDEVNKTMCSVKNFIPSISAITGAEPQRYVWRTCIALHSTPRFAVGVIYYNYWVQRLSVIGEKHRTAYQRLVSTTFWTYTVENACLVLVSFIGNFENYPLHEKIFVVFMVTSLFHQLFVLILFRWAHPQMTPAQKTSFFWKKLYFTLIMSTTACLIFFFIQHRIFCIDYAFSWFSLAEYGIAVFNIGFHYTAKQDFPEFSWCAGIKDTSPMAIKNGSVDHASGEAVTNGNGASKVTRRSAAKKAQ